MFVEIVLELRVECCPTAFVGYDEPTSLLRVAKCCSPEEIAVHFECGGFTDLEPIGAPLQNCTIQHVVDDCKNI